MFRADTTLFDCIAKCGKVNYRHVVTVLVWLISDLIIIIVPSYICITNKFHIIAVNHNNKHKYKYVVSNT